MPLNNEASERLSRKSSHAYKPREGVEINRASSCLCLSGALARVGVRGRMIKKREWG